MKKLLSLFVLIFMGLLMFAQAPQKFSYQAVVRNESNTLVRGTVGVRVSILQGGVNGDVVYQETHTTTTNINGLMTLQIGGGTMLSGDFASIDWANGPYFLKTETDPNGGTNYTIEGTQQLLSVPYALYAGSVANSFSGSYNDLTDLPQIPDIPTNVSAFNNDAGYITIDSVPEIPTNVSAFVNDAGYVTESTLTTENYITQNDLITNNYVTSADIPTNVSAFTNDAGYITANDVPAYQVLSISNDTIFLSNGGYAVLPAGFDGDYNSLTNRPNLFSGNYNDLTNTPQIPQVPTNVSAFSNDAGYITANDVPLVPTNVSAFTNDAGYITMDSVPTVPTNISAFTNDVGYVTESSLTTNNYITQNDLITNNYVTEADIPTNVSAFTNDAGYITMDSIPAIPTVPTNVSAFTNDAGYVTESMLTTENYITQNDLITNNYVTTADIPTNISAFTNDAGYITMDSVPAIPTNVSAFTNDAGYVTESMLTTENYITQNDLITNNYITTADIPTNVSAFTNDAGYITMDSIPEIPTVPTNVSAFINDAGYLTSATVQEAANIPTNVSAFNNDAGYITMDAVPTVPTNVSAFTNDAGYLTSYTETDPQFNAWDKDYNDLINRPQIPEIPANVSAFTNDAGYITMDSVPPIPTNVSAFTNDAGYVTESMLTAENYITQNDLITNNYITTADIPTNVSSFINDAGYITMDSVPTIPTNVSAFTNDAGYVTESMLTTENYITQNDLITNNYVTTADIPTNVSAFNNDAGYITMDSIPAIPTNVSAFINDAGYLTSATVQEAANIPTNVSAFNNDAGYITMDSVPTVPTVISAFTNDAGYVTESTLTTHNYITQNDLITNNYVTEADIPTNVSAFTNDAGYITMDSIPAIPTVPTNLSAFINDAGYLTSATVQEAANIPTNVSAFNNDAGYITMDSIPAIPTVPTQVSAFENDAHYLTSYTETDPQFNAWNKDYNDLINRPAIPTTTEELTNNSGFITSADVPAQVNADWNATSGAAQIMNKPTIPTVPTNISAFENDRGYITGASIPTNISAFVNDRGYVTASAIPTNVSAFTNDRGYITAADVINSDWNANSGAAQIMNKPTNVSAFTNDAHYITEAELQVLLANVTNSIDSLQQVIYDLEVSSGQPSLPRVITKNVGSITDTTAIVGCEVRNDGNDDVITRGVCWGVSPNPTISNNHTTDGLGLGDYSGILHGLNSGETYYVRAYATNNIGTAYGNQLSFTTGEWMCGTGTIVDADGNRYNTVQIGSQCWMKENLRTTKYSNGISIPQGDPMATTMPDKDSPTWFYPGNTASNKPIFGLLYNWGGAMRGESSSNSNPSGVQGICPIGWHIPSYAEWVQLTDYLSINTQFSCGENNTYIAKSLASAFGWNSCTGTCYVGDTPNNNNTTGFGALPAGTVWRTDLRQYGSHAYIWSATQTSTGSAHYLDISTNNATVGFPSQNKALVHSVRCIKD